MIFLGSINFRIGLIYWHMDIIFLNLVKIIYYRFNNMLRSMKDILN